MHLAKCLTFFFNIFNISCLTITGSELKVSKFVALKNFLILPVVITVMESVPNDIIVAGFRLDVQRVHGLTLFFVLSYSTMIISNYFMMFICIYIQFWRRYELKALVDSCIEFYRKHRLDTCALVETEKMRTKHKLQALILLMTLLYFMEFTSMMNLNWEGILMFLFNLQNGFVLFPFFLLVNCFISFFLTSIECLNLRLEKLAHAEFKEENFIQILTFFSDLHNLIEEFHRVIGFLMSFIVAIVTTTQIIRVNATVKLCATNLESHFQLYLIAVAIRGLVTMTIRTKFLNLSLCASLLLTTLQLVLIPCEKLSKTVSKTFFIRAFEEAFTLLQLRNTTNLVSDYNSSLKSGNRLVSKIVFKFSSFSINQVAFSHKSSCFKFHINLSELQFSKLSC